MPTPRRLGFLALVPAAPVVLVRRGPHGRRATLPLGPFTVTGRKALTRVERALDGLEDSVLAALSSDERATLRDLLTRAVADVPAPVSTI